MIREIIQVSILLTLLFIGYFVVFSPPNQPEKKEKNVGFYSDTTTYFGHPEEKHATNIIIQNGIKEGQIVIENDTVYVHIYLLQDLTKFDDRYITIFFQQLLKSMDKEVLYLHDHTGEYLMTIGF